MRIHFHKDEDYILENEMVLLRPLEADDFEFLLPFALREADLWKYSVNQAKGELGLMHYIELALKAREEGRGYPFIVFDKFRNTYAGSTRFHDIQLATQCAQIGYTWFGRQFQGTGVNKHAKYLMLEFAFETAGFERIEFRVDHSNARSIAALKSLGCTYDGRLRSNGLRPDGTRRDSIVYSILKEEWMNLVKENLGNKLSTYLPAISIHAQQEALSA